MDSIPCSKHYDQVHALGDAIWPRLFLVRFVASHSQELDQEIKDDSYVTSGQGLVTAGSFIHV